MPKTIRKTLSVSTLTGDPVVNLDGEKIGKLEELMVDVTDGSVGYAVLSFGGFLGIGDKLFALPWRTLRVDEQNKQIVVDLDKKALEAAPGFDKDNWPDFADDAYRQQVDKYYQRR
jgi:sporulation protein YlmC with PRC-barrel domain